MASLDADYYSESSSYYTERSVAAAGTLPTLDEASSEYSYSSGSYSERTTDRSTERHDSGGLLGWVHSVAEKISGGGATHEPKGILYTPREVKPAGRHAARVGKIASIPWRELVHLKEALLTQMEGIAVAEERLDERAAIGMQHEVALARAAAQLDEAIRELEKVAQANHSEANQMTAALQDELAQLRREHTVLIKQRRTLAEEAESRRVTMAGRGLGADVERGAAAKLEVAQAWAEQTSLAVAMEKAVLNAEIDDLTAEVSSVVALATSAAALAAGHTARSSRVGDGVGDAAQLGAELTEARRLEADTEAALTQQIRTIEARFTHRRPVPPMRAAALVSRWRRLQEGEHFERLHEPLGTSSPPTLERFAPQMAPKRTATPERVWLRLSSDMHALELAPAKGAEATARLRLAGVVHMAHGRRAAALLSASLRASTGSTALQLSLVSVLGGSDWHLRASEAAQLAFWWTGLQALTSIPEGERLSRGALLWRSAGALYREKYKSAKSERRPREVSQSEREP